MKKLLFAMLSLIFLIACSSDKKAPNEESTEKEKVATTEEKPDATIESQEAQEELEDSVTLKIEEHIKAKAPKVQILEVIDDEDDGIYDPVKIEFDASPIEVEIAKPIRPDHGMWNNVLGKYVSSNGKVNYAGIKANPAQLNAYIKSLQEFAPSSSWSKNDKLTYWMNAYNAFTIQLVVKNYPLKSIKDIGNPWDKKFIELGGKTYSLNDIENGILRKMGDPRIHFGINCASVSCPKLSNKAFTSNQVNSQLNTLTKGFLNDKSKNNIATGKVVISKVFDWFKADFTNGGTVLDYLNKYSSISIASDAVIEYQEYDWNLNN